MLKLIAYGEETECTHVDKGADYIKVFMDDQLIREDSGITDFSGYSLVDGDGKPVLWMQLDELRAAKLAEVGGACTTTIYAGVDVETSEGTKHFSLEGHDQTELMGLKPSLDALIAAGDLTTPAIPYHADGELCCLWTAADFGAILQTAMGWIAYQRTYCNHLNMWIKRCEDYDELQAIVYGAELPEDLAANMQAILAAAAGEGA